ncbi:MAG: undecaprenyl-diphosphate phosphatase [Victivallaceae bacterium]|nr:undecaprenyl-diphosphate phosphatase [Victivallaceae bacterium]
MESSLFFVIFMAAVQGIAEFLPISSSGHLAVMGRLFGFDAETNAVLNIVLHAGTLLAILIYYFKELLAILQKYDFKLVGQLALATVPVGISGLTVKLLGWDESIFNNLFVPGAGFLITATLLLRSRKPEAGKSIDELGCGKSFLIGLVQAFAVLPGVSRSGSTIAAGFKCGLKSEDAARFSFLLAVPAIGGVAFVKLLMLLKNTDSTLHSLGVSYLAAGFIVSALVGYFSLCLLLRLLKRGDFKYFAWYLYFLGLATLIWAITDACF